MSYSAKLRAHSGIKWGGIKCVFLLNRGIKKNYIEIGMLGPVALVWILVGDFGKELNR
jgi:hypothetical protein